MIFRHNQELGWRQIKQAGAKAAASKYAPPMFLAALGVCLVGIAFPSISTEIAQGVTDAAKRVGDTCFLQ